MAEESSFELADKAVFVFTVYAVILTPLALYVYHDILDKRWRPVWRLVRFLIGYALLYIVAGSGLVVYIVIQFKGNDYKEVGASTLALILGTYGAWKLIRLARIIRAHYRLVSILKRIDRSLCSLTGLKPVGMVYSLLHSPPSANRKKTLGRAYWDREPRHEFISSSLFDDDYPGEASARIKWLGFNGKIRVVQEDADECASRVALWMRLVLRRPRSEPWKLLTSTSPLVQGQLYRANLGEALRALITHGSVKSPPSTINPNPAEVLLNNGSLTTAGIGFFWMASEMGSEEMSQVLAEMPPRWMRGVTQNGKQLMFELVMSLLLCEMPPCPNQGLRWILSLPVLEWSRDISNLYLWNEMANVCAEAVRDLMPQATLAGTTAHPAEVFETVRSGVFDLQEATCDGHEFQGDIVGLTLLELIRASYRAGYIAEQILTTTLQEEIERIAPNLPGKMSLYKAEIVTGLFSVLRELGQHKCPKFQEYFDVLKASWGNTGETDDVFLAMKERAQKDKNESFNLNHVASSQCWYFGDRDAQVEDPHVAFSTLVSSASEITPLVLFMLENYRQKRPEISLQRTGTDIEEVRLRWLSMKRDQALELSSSQPDFSVQVEELEEGFMGRSIMLPMAGSPDGSQEK